jgi:hypothetical protein
MVDKPGFGLLIVCLLSLIPGRIARADEPFASRRQRIEKMDSAQKEQILRRHKQFHAFKPEDREQLRNLHRDIENDPDRDELRRVLDRYYDWLKTLSSYQLMELRKLSPEERIERIKVLQQEKHVSGRSRGRFGYGRFSPGFDRYGKMAGEIGARDREALLQWAAEYAARSEDAFFESLPDVLREQVQRELSTIDDSRNRAHVLFWRMWLRRQLDDPKEPLLHIDDDWPRLLEALSPSTRETLEALPKGEQHANIAGKIRILALEHYFSRRSGSVPSVISEKELAGFFANDLDQGLRSRLMGLPSADMQRVVWRLYLMSKMPGMSQGFSPVGSGRARRPGPQRHAPPSRGGEKRPDFGRPGPPLDGQLGPEDPPPRPGHPRNHADEPGRRSENGRPDSRRPKGPDQQQLPHSGPRGAAPPPQR